MQRLLIMCALVGFAGALQGQTKSSGTISCNGTPEINTMADAGDAPGHMYMLQKQTCNWSKPFAIGSAKTTQETDVSIGEIRAGKSTQHGNGTTLLDDGDTLHVAFEGSGMMKPDGSGTSRGSWHFVNGTGKAKGIRGGGHFKTTIAAGGTATVDVTGSYSLGGEKAAKKEKK